MSAPDDPIDAETLLAHAGFVRTLARQLVRDDLVDDVVQDAWVVALRHPPRRADALRTWLYRVVHSLTSRRLQRDAHRATWERQAAVSERVAAPDETVARLGVFRAVIEHVIALDEPYRSTVLLRFFHDQSLRAIATQQQVPVATVETRLRRALAQLRERLDRSQPDRTVWMSALAAIATPRGSIAWIGGALVSHKLLLVGVMALVIVLASALGMRQCARPVEGHGAQDATLARSRDMPARDQEGIAAATRADVSPAPNATSATTDMAIRGRVVDEHRFPVPGARVSLAATGAEVTEAETDRDGRFTLPLRERRHESWFGAVYATDDAGHSGIEPVAIYGESEPPPVTVALLPSARLDVLVRSGGGPVTGATVSVECGKHRLSALRDHTGTDGRVALDDVPAGEITVIAETNDRRGRTARILRRDADELVTVELASKRHIAVMVTDAATQQPIAGAKITVRERTLDARIPLVMKTTETFVPPERPLDLDVPLTDAKGRTWLDGIGVDQTLHVRAEALGFLESKSVRVRPTDDSAVLRLDRIVVRSLRFPVVAGDAPAPANGTRVQLRARGSSATTLPAETMVTDGALVLELHSWLSAFAFSADGAIGLLSASADAEIGNDVVFRRPRHIAVTVREASGEPAVEALIEVKDQGNNEIVPSQRTDASGGTIFSGLWGRHADVFLRRSRREPAIPIGSVDLDAGDGAIDATLAPRAEYLVRVLLDGKPGLPPSFVLTQKAERLFEWQEDPARGELRLTLDGDRHGPSLLHLHAPGYGDGAVALERPAPFVNEVRLQAAGALVVHVMPPADGRVDLQLHRLRGDRTWQGLSILDDAGKAPDPGTSDYRFAALQAGRYRVRDRDTRLLSEEVEVVPGEEPARVVLDLSRAGLVTGRVVLPDGESLEHALVRVSGTDIDGYYPARGELEGKPVRDDGHFWLRVPGDRPVTLVAVHPVLTGVPVTLVSARSDLVLELRLGNIAVLEQPTLLASELPIGARITLYLGEARGTPIATFTPRIADGSLVFGGFEPGTYSLWIDPRWMFAPIVLRDVNLGAGVTRIVMPTFTAGSSLRVSLTVRDGQAYPRIHVWARALDEPSFDRQMTSTGEPSFALGGLAQGDYEVRIGPVMDERMLFAGNVHVDGVRDHDMPIDLR